VRIALHKSKRDKTSDVTSCFRTSLLTVANLAQSLNVVVTSIGDLVDVVLHGQLGIQVPDDNVTLDYRPTDLNGSKALWYSGQDACTKPEKLGFRRVELKS